MGVTIESDVCFKPQITADTYRITKLYNHYKNGVLLYGGGLLEQPAAYLEAMELIETLINSR